MFDMFSMLGKISSVGKEMKELKSELKAMKVTDSDSKNLVTVTLNANKEFENITISDEFLKQPKEQAQAVLQKTISNAFDKASIKGRHEFEDRIEDKIPNIPGFDLKDMPFY